MQPRDNGTDNPTRFLTELRGLRDRAGLAHTELAARSHYPSDLLQAAEKGPGLPDLPVLSAYVRGCGGEVTEWEDRWRILSGTGGPGLLPSRPAGESAAAAAGARAGASVAPPDEHDPARIMAVLARASGSVRNGNGSSHADSTAGSMTSAGSVFEGAGPAGAASSSPAPADSVFADTTSAADAALDIEAEPAPVSAPGNGTQVTIAPQPRAAGSRQVRAGSNSLPVPALIAIAAGVLIVVVALLVGMLGLRGAAVRLARRAG